MNNVSSSIKDILLTADTYNFFSLKSIYCILDYSQISHSARHTSNGIKKTTDSYALLSKILHTLEHTLISKSSRFKEVSIEVSTGNRAIPLLCNFYSSNKTPYTIRIIVSYNVFKRQQKALDNLKDNVVVSLAVPSTLLSDALENIQSSAAVGHVSVEYKNLTSPLWRKTRELFSSYSFSPYMLWHFSRKSTHASYYLKDVYLLNNYLGLLCGYKASSKSYPPPAISYMTYKNKVFMGKHNSKNTHIIWQMLNPEEEFAIRIRQGAYSLWGLKLPRRLQSYEHRKILKDYKFTCAPVSHSKPERWVRNIKLWYNVIN